MSMGSDLFYEPFKRDIGLPTIARQRSSGELMNTRTQSHVCLQDAAVLFAVVLLDSKTVSFPRLSSRSPHTPTVSLMSTLLYFCTTFHFRMSIYTWFCISSFPFIHVSKTEIVESFPTKFTHSWL